MAHLWMMDASNQWTTTMIDKNEFNLGSVEDLTARPEAVIMQTQSGCKVMWVLLSEAHADVWINGIPSSLGIQVLADRDEVRTGQGPPTYFSTESLPTVVEFPDTGQPIFCPRCKQEIVANTAAVRCPDCMVWHHQVAQLPCWDYSDKCATCGRNTDLNGRFTWTPEAI